MSEKLYKMMPVEVKEVDADKATLEAIFSTANEDRHGDIVQQNWDLKHFKKNPVILNSHNYSDATETIGKASAVKVKDGKLQGKITFAVNENPKAKVIFDLFAGGFLNAFSVGFIPKEFSDKGEILKSELLEVSAVSVPANAMALAKAKGIKVEKLYEPTTKDNNEDEGSDGDSPEGGCSCGKDGGEESGEEVQGSEEGSDGEREETEEENNQVEYDEQKETKEEAEEEKEEDGGGVRETAEERAYRKQQSIYKNIVKAAKTLGEASKVVTPQDEVRAETKRLANKAIRELLKAKQNI